MQKLTLLSTITRFYPNHLIKSWVRTKLSILITLGKYSGGKGILQIPIAINAMYLWSFCYKEENILQNTGKKVNLSIWVKSRLKKLKPNCKRILPNLWFAVVYGKKIDYNTVLMSDKLVFIITGINTGNTSPWIWQ